MWREILVVITIFGLGTACLIFVIAIGLIPLYIELSKTKSKKCFFIVGKLICRKNIKKIAH